MNLNKDDLLFVKVGNYGNVDGYKNKYLHLAGKISATYGTKVVCLPTFPDIVVDEQIESVLSGNSQRMDLPDARNYFVGFSLGASQGAAYSLTHSNISRYLLVNPPLRLNLPRLIRAMKNFNGEMMTFAFGEFDYSARLSEVLRLHERENVRVKMIPGQDHRLSQGEFDLFGLVEELL